ncbi:MAG TPA: hypothetical protein VK281_07500, partial [Xanthobacteraceae bacterium]|nr:hypothetical protein [Xanthobacteraceae bacterium]
MRLAAAQLRSVGELSICQRGAEFDCVPGGVVHIRVTPTPRLVFGRFIELYAELLQAIVLGINITDVKVHL